MVFIIPEWWGMNDYVKNRARQLADSGYMVVAVDMYGEGKMVDNPDDAGKLAKPFYGNADLAKQSFELALKQIEKMKSRYNQNGCYRLLLWRCYGT